MEPLELTFTVASPPSTPSRSGRRGRRRGGRTGHSVSAVPGLRLDRADATEVEIRFAPDRAAAGTTAVTIVHRGRGWIGAKGPERRARNRRGWDGLVPHDRAACAA